MVVSPSLETTKIPHRRGRLLHKVDRSKSSSKNYGGAGQAFLLEKTHMHLQASQNHSDR